MKGMELQVAGFLDNSLVNGSGLRSVVFVSGCRNNCEGCHNKEMQDFNYGDKMSVKEISDRIKRNVPIIRGVTFSGGEPFEQAEALAELAGYVKGEELNLWCYSGYTYEFITSEFNKRAGWKELMKYIDVLVDGKFEKDKIEPGLKFRGSSNQRIIDVKKSRLEGKVITIC